MEDQSNQNAIERDRHAAQRRRAVLILVGPGVDHCHWPRQEVRLEAESLEDPFTARHLVNHETGHVLGLSDPCAGTGTRDCSQIGWRYCRAEIPLLGTIWIDSIMHAPVSYCSSYGALRPWPTSLDFKGAAGIMELDESDSFWPDP